VVGRVDDLGVHVVLDRLLDEHRELPLRERGDQLAALDRVGIRAQEHECTHALVRHRGLGPGERQGT